MKITISILIVLGLIAGGWYYTQSTKPHNTGICGDNGEWCPGTPGYEARMKKEQEEKAKTLNEPVTTNLENTQKYTFSDSTKRANCKEWNGPTTTEISAPVVGRLKGYVLNNTNISSKYFDEHFKFGCAMEVGTQYEFGIFYFTIGEYVRDIQVDSSLPGIWLKGLNEIKSVISKDKAIKKMVACIDNPNKALALNLTSKGLLLTGYGDNWMVGEINLETGICTKKQSKPQI